MSENLSDNNVNVNSNNNKTASTNNNINSSTDNTVNANTSNNINSSTDNTVKDSPNNITTASTENTETANTCTAEVIAKSAPSNKPPIKKEPKYKFESIDVIMLPVVFILGFLCTKYYNLNTSITTLGLGATFYIVLYVISVLVYAKLKAVKPNRESIILPFFITIPLVYLCK